jgi:putative transposase
MKVIRCATFLLKDTVVDNLCLSSKNLYNHANYIIRKEFIENKKWIRYRELFQIIKNSDGYFDIGSNVGQMTLKILDKNWKSFFNGMRYWKKNRSNYLGIPNLPKYLDKNGRFLLIIDNIKFRIVDDYIYFSWSKLKHLNNRFNVSWIPNITKLCEIRFVPMGVGYKLELVYQTEVPETEPINDRIVGIDLGLENFVTMVNNIGQKPIVVKGGALKSMNQFYNKKRSKIQEELKTKNKKSTSKRLSKLTQKRNEKIMNFMHVCSKRIIDYCVLYEIDTMVVGKNDGWKQCSKMSKIVNQSFVQIPMARFVDLLRYKCENNGINFIVTEESYTSKASFLDNDDLPTFKEGKETTFSGKRIKRGLYQSSNGTIINADCNGAYNIIKKAIPKAFNGIEGVGLHPATIKITRNAIYGI